MAAETMVVRCMAEGKNGDWLGLCLDFDLAVQGESFEEVYQNLIEVVVGYVDTVMSYPPEERKPLLRRKAPLLLRLRFTAKYLQACLSWRPSGKDYHSYTTHTKCPV